jgi:hypothetical protein
MKTAKTTIPDAMPKWLTIKLLSEIEPSFTPASIRNIVFMAKDRETPNGIHKGN